MELHAFEGVYGPEIEVDLCFSCHLIWLDKRESLHLAPGGTMELFRVLHDHRDDARHALRRRLPCARCERRLSLHNDVGKAGRFHYFACPAGDGRLTPFSEFLKEKQFVRALTPLEKTRVRAELKNVQCSSCGAPVDLERGFDCGHCGAPLTVLDADAVKKTLQELDDRHQSRQGDTKEKEARARALAELEAARSYPEDFAAPERGLGLNRPIGLGKGGEVVADLLSLSMGYLFGKR